MELQYLRLDLHGQFGRFILGFGKALHSRTSPATHDGRLNITVPFSHYKVFAFIFYYSLSACLTICLSCELFLEVAELIDTKLGGAC